jgi:BMFP domain-containing protein YqiC
VTSNSEDAVERIRQLEETLARTPAGSGMRRDLAKAIRIQADAYRKALDVEQATEEFDKR